jgi:hypothetical protein
MYLPQTYRGKSALCVGACRGVEAGTEERTQNEALVHGYEDITVTGGKEMKKFIKIPLIILGSVFGIFVILLVIGAVSSTTKKSSNNYSTERHSSENTTESILIEQKTSSIKYSDYTNLLMGYDLAKLLNDTPNGSKWSIGLSVLRKNGNVWRVSNGGQYADFNVPSKFNSVYNENENYYLFLVDVSVRNNSRTITVVEVIPFTAMGIPNETDNGVLKLRTPRGFNIEGFFQEYLDNINNPEWINPIKQVPDVTNSKYGKYLRWLGGSSLTRAEDGATGYFISDGIKQYQVRNIENDGSGWFPLKPLIDTYYFKEEDRETLLRREYAEGNGGLLLLLRKVKGSGSRADRTEVDKIILLKDLGLSYGKTFDVDVEMKVAEYFLRNN